MLEEKLVHIRKDATFIKRLNIPENKCAYNWKYILVVMSDKEQCFVRGFWGTTVDELKKWSGYQKELEKYRENFGVNTIYDYVFFDNLFVASRAESFSTNEVYKRRFQRERIVDQVLRDSHGFLLWKYQLDNLMRVFAPDNKGRREATRLLEGVNLTGRESIFERENAIQELKEIGVNDKVSLYDVLSQRIVGGKYLRVRVPIWRYARNLYYAMGEVF